LRIKVVEVPCTEATIIHPGVDVGGELILGDKSINAKCRGEMVKVYETRFTRSSRER
jgi:hypothetical protein